MIALGLEYKNSHFHKSILTQDGFSSNLMAICTALQLDKYLWPSQILLVYRLGKVSPTPETQHKPHTLR